MDKAKNGRPKGKGGTEAGGRGDKREKVSEGGGKRAEVGAKGRWRNQKAGGEMCKRWDLK
jgi:hypothetical protein